jgi:hypothetical protein
VPPFNATNITYATLAAFLAGPGLVRVYHHKSRARLSWDGTEGGFTSPSSRALSPEAYAWAMDAAQLGGRWGLGIGVRESAAQHILGELEDSPWISATASLDSAIAMIAHELALGVPEVRMAVLLPSTEVRVRAADLKPPRGCDEWLFYGQIFARSVVADTRWTRAVGLVRTG